MKVRLVLSAWLAVVLPIAARIASGAPQVTTGAADQTILWQIGQPDHDTAEFALGRDGWRGYAKAFADDAVFVVGRSDAKKDWPYAHPGPVDAWAGSRPHTFTVFFGLKKAPQDAACRLLIGLADTQRPAPPKWRVDINGHAVESQLPAGAGDESVNGKPAGGRAHRLEVPIPASTLRAGTNVVTIQSVAGSWALYDWVGLEAPPGVEGGAVEPFTSITGASDGSVLLRGSDGGVGQPLHVTIQHVGEPTEAALSVGEGPALAVSLRQGTHHVEVMAPPAQSATQVPLTLRVGGKTVAERPVELKPVRRWTVYLLPHSHVDIGYTQVQDEVEKKQWNNLETAIAAARRTAGYPEGSRFKWNVEVMWAVDSYLRQASTDQQQAFAEAVRKGWVELDALYGNELTALCRQEELMRLVECGGQVSRRLGVPLEVAMISDVPGYTWGMVPVLAQAGVKYFSVGPNPGDRIGGTLAVWGDKPFYWVGPSGLEKVLCWVAGTGYAFYHGAALERVGAEPLLQHLRRLADSGYPYDLVQVRYSTGGDNGPPDPTVCEFVRKWNDTHESPRLVIATCSEMFRALESRYRDVIPTASGDFTPYWEDGAASSARETAMNRASAERLSQAETLFALRNPSGYPAEAFSKAWRNVILYDEHTWGAWNSISEPDAPFVAQQWKIKQAFAVDADKESAALLARALGAAGASPARHVSVDVFNTTSWTRTDLVTVPRSLDNGENLVADENGKPAPSQRLSTGELVFRAQDVPPLACRRYTLSAGTGAPIGSARAGGAALLSELVTVRIDERTGAIASLRCAGAPAELVDTKSPVAINDYRYMLGSDRAGARPNGPVTIRVKEPGPLVASLTIESDAPGCRRLTREVRIIDGLDRVEMIDTVDKLPVRQKEGVHFGFAFNVPAGQVRVDTPWAVVRPEADQLPGSCRNWLTAQRWVDISNAHYGVTWATPDAPLIEVGEMTADRIGSLSNPGEWLTRLGPSQTFYSWVMNNHWHTNYRAEQEGPTPFRFAIRAHGPYDGAEAQRFGIGCAQPLIVGAAAGAAPRAIPLLEVFPLSVLVTSLRPSADGRALIVRLFNPTDGAVTATLKWGGPGVGATYRTTSAEEVGDEIRGRLDLPPWGIATLRH